MTIAAGFKCTDGLVLCSDTEYTWDSVLKLPGPKIYTHREPSFSLAFAGAGDVDFIRMAVQRIVNALKGQNPTFQQIEVCVQVIIKRIHQEHLYPFPGITYERPTVELLIGIWTKEGGLELLKTRLNECYES